MMSIEELQQLIPDNIPPWLSISLGFVALFLFAVVIKAAVLARLEKLISKTPFYLDTLAIQSLKRPLDIVILALVLVVVHNFFEVYFPDLNRLGSVITYGTKFLLILALILFTERFAVGAIQHYAGRSETLRNSSSMAAGAARVLIIVLGALIVLGTLGVSITPIIASLGITSLAVALALQPTLENFFSGLQILADKPIRVGDFIELDSGEQGFVEKIGWRSTWIKMLANNTVIMPNSILAQSKIINYFYPAKELSVPVEVGVHYDSDLELVERVTIEVATEVLEQHEMGVKTFKPFLTFHTFDNSSINFTVILRGQEYFNRFFISSAFIKALHKRYREEGIVIPYPIRALNLSQEQAELMPQHNGQPHKTGE